MVLPLESAMTSSKPTSNPDSQAISLILKKFQRPFVKDELLKHLVGKFTSENQSEQNKLICIP